MKWLALLICLGLLLTPTATARTDTPPNESKPELVKGYLFLPCDALEDSYAFMHNELSIITGRLMACHAAKENNTYKYKHLMCLYVEMQWNFVYEHAMSMAKAYDIMCDAVGRKNPEYEIEF